MNFLINPILCRAVMPASQVVLVVKNPSVNAGDTGVTGSIPGSGRSTGGGHGNPSSIPAERIPCAEEPGRLQSLGRIEANMTEQLSIHEHHASRPLNQRLRL